MRLPYFWRTRPMPQWGMLLLAIWLIVSGLLALLQVNFAYSGVVLPLLALAAGILLLVRS